MPQIGLWKYKQVGQLQEHYADGDITNLQKGFSSTYVFIFWLVFPGYFSVSKQIIC